MPAIRRCGLGKVPVESSPPPRPLKMFCCFVVIACQSSPHRDEPDGGGNTVKTLNPLNHSITRIYDALGRDTSTTTFAGTTSTSYNNSTGRVDSQTDAKSNATSFTYDILGRQTVVTDRLGETTTRVYDSAGFVSGSALAAGPSRLGCCRNLKSPVASAIPLTEKCHVTRSEIDKFKWANSLLEDRARDAKGKRTWERVTCSSVIVENTVYVYAGPNCVAEYNYGGATNAPVMEYIYAGEIDSLAMIARNNNAQKLIATRNQQWSIVSLCDNANGTVLERYTYDQFGKRKILAADRSTVRTSSSYDNPYGYTSRRHDAESGLMYFRARYYDVTTGEFTSRDPLEYVDGMSAYRGYFVPNGTDPIGFWKHVGGTIYEADGEEDSLMSLSWKIVGHNDDWVCIWPVGDLKLWSSYPWAKSCARADVSNLEAIDGPNLIMAPRSRDGYVNNIFKWLKNNYPKNARKHRWESGAEAAQEIADLAKMGKTPITGLALGAHCHSGNVIGDVGLKRPFSSNDLINLGGPNTTNTLERASKMEGPSRCWFCNDAEVIAFACNSSGFAEEWANKILRRGAHAVGTRTFLFVSDDAVEIGFSSTFPRNTPTLGGGPARTWGQARRLTGWISFPGQPK